LEAVVFTSDTAFLRLVSASSVLAFETKEELRASARAADKIAVFDLSISAPYHSEEATEATVFGLGCRASDLFVSSLRLSSMSAPTP
jgi:hypothetical protein